jgi:magnesium transporter
MDRCWFGRCTRGLCVSWLLVKWHDITNINDPELDRLAAEYHIHPLHIEDCRSGGQRAKVEENDGYIFVVFKPVEFAEGGGLSVWDLDIFLGRGWVITVREHNCDPVEKVLQAIHAMEASLREDQVLYRVSDGVVDSYLPLLDRIDDQIDEMEEQVLDTPTPEVLARIFRTRRTLIEMRRVLANTRDVAAHLYRSEHELIGKDLMPFMRDVYDHVARNLDLVETQRDLLTGTMDVYLSSVANRTNQVMKVLTIMGTIALPVLVISGFYGMNTKGLPFADSPYGLVIVSALMLLSTLGLLGLLKKFGWF